MRTTFYRLILALALAQTALGSYMALVRGFIPNYRIIGNVAAYFSVLTWLWVSFLLTYSNRPNSTHKLTKVWAHLFSFISFVPTWLALGIMIFTLCPYHCDPSRSSGWDAPGGCGVSVAAGVASVLISILSAASAVVIRRGGRALGENIVEGRSKAMVNEKA
ncbi:hypothetical protein GALMADRAFT_138920 [Galerina marginata CBS 339.88]|uniref:MARVEL domain-containing protein n=1 Tax=Galerina marginata (strain CBS 339.88) TaxID=685588 RepID=A0A067TAG2_GALM3|nr:hypothetical protein GALMADRAFT_138920 [Galerina marginata CBS 339.88]